MKKASKGATLLTIMLMTASFLFTSGFSFITLSRDVLKTETEKVSFELPFTDIKGIPAEGAVMEMYARSVINGDESGTFRPKQPVTNMESIVLIDRLLGYKPAEEDIESNIYLKETFDIPQWAVGYIGWALDKNLITYEELPKMSLKEPMIKQDAAVLAVRALGLTKEAKKRKASELKFLDTAQLTPELKGYISVAAEQGIMESVADGTFQPASPVSRGEMAIILSKLSDVLHLPADNQSVGFIKEIDGGKRTIVLSGINAMEFNLILPEDYVCYLDLKPTTLDALETGEYVSVLTREGGSTVVMAKTKGSDKGINIPFENLDPGQAPEEIAQWVDSNKNTEQCAVKKLDNNLYILVSRGEKKTAGYAVNITQVSGMRDQEALNLTIGMEMTDPDPDALVSQVIDYPFVLIRLADLGDALSSIEFVNKQNQKIAEIINKG